MKDHKCSMVTWGGQLHYHKARRNGEEVQIPCSEMHGYCMDPLCHTVHLTGDDRASS